MKKLFIPSAFILILGLFSCKKETVTSTSQEEIATGKPPSPPPPASFLQWQKCLGSSSDEFGSAIAKTSDGYFVGGIIRGSNGLNDALVFKIDLNGQPSPGWQSPVIVGGSGVDEINGIVATPDGGCLAAGYTVSNDEDLLNHGNGNLLLVKLSSSGAKEWVKTIGGSGTEKANALIKTSDGGYALVGYTNSTDGDVTNSQVTDGNAIVWLVKFNITSTGPTIEWQRTFPNSYNKSGSGYSLVQAADDGYTIVGTVYTDPAPDIWTVNTDNIGNVNWERIISSGTGGDVAFSVTASKDLNDNINGYLVTGYLSTATMVAKLNLDGTTNWQKTFPLGQGRSVISTNQGDIIVGWTGQDLFVLRVDDANGNQISSNLLGGNKSDAGKAVIPTDGGYIAVGDTNSNNGNVSGNHGGSDVWIIKFKFDN